VLEPYEGPRRSPGAGRLLDKEDVRVCFVGLLEDRLVSYILLVCVMLDKLDVAIRRDY
jgi:hypothetical protein